MNTIEVFKLVVWTVVVMLIIWAVLKGLEMNHEDELRWERIKYAEKKADEWLEEEMARHRAMVKERPEQSVSNPTKRRTSGSTNGHRYTSCDSTPSIVASSPSYSSSCSPSSSSDSGGCF